MGSLKAIVVRGSVAAITVGRPGPEGRAGADGADGADGAAGLSWVSAGWSVGLSVAANDALLHNGSSYRATGAHTAAAETEPGVGSDWATVWVLLAVGPTIVYSDTEPVNPAIGTYWFRPRDTTAPVITDFTLPATAGSLTVNVSTLTATDAVGVTGYYLSESPATPGVGQSGWSASPPATFDCAGQGTRTVYAWAKDAAGNVSNPASDSVEITLPNQAPAASIAASNQSATGFTAAGVVYGIGAGDSLASIRVAWLLQGVDADPVAAVAAGRTSLLTAGADLTAYQGSGKAISAALAIGSYLPAVQVTENMSGGGTQTGEWVLGSAFVVSLTAPTGVAVTPTSAQNSIAWLAVPGATSYDLYWLDTGADPTKATGTKITGVTSPHAHTGLTDNVLRKYCVVAVNSGGESVESAVVAALMDPFADLANWTNPSDSTQPFSVVAGVARSSAAGASVMRRAIAMTRSFTVRTAAKRLASASQIRLYAVAGTSVSGATGYMVNYATGSLFLNRLTAGTSTQLDSEAFTLAANTQYALTWEILSGGQINFYVDGVLKLSASDNTHSALSYLHLYTGDANQVEFDNLSVTD